MNDQDRNQFTKLDIRVGNIEKTIEIIKTNDLPHINEELASIKSKVAFFPFLAIGAISIGVAVLGVVAAILIVVI